MTRLTSEEIETIRKRAEKASDGDWYSEVSTFENATEKLTEIAVQPGVAMSVRTEADAEFIANAREDIPKLLAEVDRLRNAFDQLNDNRMKWMESHGELEAEIARWQAELSELNDEIRVQAERDDIE